jgi:hypothetical protein
MCASGRDGSPSPARSGKPSPNRCP